MVKKAQMFIITALFLIGLVFSVQQLVFQYTALDLSSAFRENSIYLLRNTRDAVNRTMAGTPDCADFEVNMRELKDFLDMSVPRGGYSLSVSYRLNCTYWGNSPPQPAPLNLTVQIVGKGSDTSSTTCLYRR